MVFQEVQLLEPTFKSLRYFQDTRGYSLFNVFNEISSGQINISHLRNSAIKAFHKHEFQEDNWICIKGDIHVICWKDKIIKHFYIGEHNQGILNIPVGWYHGYTNLTDESDLLYWVTKAYDPLNADEIRLPYDYLGKEIWDIENK